MSTESARRVSQSLQELAAALDKTLERIAGERVAFSLFVWTPEFSNYISSTNDREVIIKVLEQHIANWRAGCPDIPAHKRQ